jgi:hypothetical protein
MQERDCLAALQAVAGSVCERDATQLLSVALRRRSDRHDFLTVDQCVMNK